MDNPVHPLQRLFTYARQYRPDVIRATLYSILNKFFDVLPAVLIGVAVDVVVNKQDSFIAKLGIADPKQQIVALAILTAIVWIAESLFEYLYNLKWRNLAQNLLPCGVCKPGSGKWQIAFNSAQATDVLLFKARTEG